MSRFGTVLVVSAALVGYGCAPTVPAGGGSAEAWGGATLGDQPEGAEVMEQVSEPRPPVVEAPSPEADARHGVAGYPAWWVEEPLWRDGKLLIAVEGVGDSLREARSEAVRLGMEAVAERFGEREVPVSITSWVAPPEAGQHRVALLLEVDAKEGGGRGGP
jgi:hypothetical protein